MYQVLIISLTLFSLSVATSPPILNRSLASQLRPDNPAISSAFLVPPSSALLSNRSESSPALRVPPSWSFSIGFLGDTFLNANGNSHNLSFDAQLDTGDPLPDWLHFAADTITFGGVTPDQNRGILTLNIIVTATSSSSSYTSDTFTLIVSPHDLSLISPLQTRNVTADANFTFIIDDWQGVQVDGSRMPSMSPNNSVTSGWAATDNSPPPLSLALNTTSYPWLLYDAASRTLSGTPPASYVGDRGLLILALVTLAFPPQALTVSTNLTLDVLPPTFTMNQFPPIHASPGTSIMFDLAPFIASNASPSIILNTRCDPQNATWLHFDPKTKVLNGTVPARAISNVRVFFIAQDPARGTDNRAQLLITIGGEDGNVRSPTDRALRKSANKVSLAVGLVCGIVAAIVFLAIFLATCRCFCAAREYIDGAYVIDQSAFDEGLKSGGAYEKEAVSDIDGPFLALPRVTLTPPASEGGMITKAAFFSGMRERLGNDGSWRGRLSPNPSFGSGKRARKSKISKPMAVLSSTSVREGFADRGRGGVTKSKVNTSNGTNFTIFGNKNNAHGSIASTNSNRNSLASGNALPHSFRADVSLSLGRMLVTPESLGGTVVLPYDRSHSHSDESQKSALSVGSSGPDTQRSGSARSMATGTQTGTQSTFATGDSARLTNAAGEIPIRRPGFDGRRETLAERSMREMTNSGALSNPGHVSPSRMLLKTISTKPTPKALPTTTTTPATVSSPAFPFKVALQHDEGSKHPSAPQSVTSPEESKDSSPSKLSSVSNKNTSRNPVTGTLSVPSKPGSEVSLPVQLSYRNVFFGDECNESGRTESGADDAEHAVIRHAVQRTSDDTLARQGTAGKPRLVAFTHERTPAASEQTPRRDVSQRVVVQGSEESDPEAEMRMGLEYVRQLGHPEAQQDISQTKVSTSRVSLIPDHTDAPNVEFYASNDSNGSIAGRTRVMSHLVINSHRHRHQTAYSTESLLSSGAEEIQWTAEAELPCIRLGPGEPFNFAAPLDRGHKHASALACSALIAKQMDGRALPEWLRFRNIEREFWGVSPKNASQDADKALAARVVVNIWEAEKSMIVGGCVIDVLENEW